MQLPLGGECSNKEEAYPSRDHGLLMNQQDEMSSYGGKQASFKTIPLQDDRVNLQLFFGIRKQKQELESG